jgi:hypothetical protein
VQSAASVKFLLRAAHLHKGRVSVHLKSSSRIYTDIPLLILATLVLLAQPSGNAVAEDLLGLYVGGTIGQSRGVEAIDSIGFPVYNGVVTETQSFEGRHTAFSVMLGVRPISLLGAEIDYIDLGRPSGSS